jgi:hypothetical protein
VLPSDRPALSVVVAIVSDTLQPPTVDRLRECLKSLFQQVDAPTLEIIVPHLTGVVGINPLKVQFPDIRFLAIGELEHSTGGSREHHNQLRAHGVAAARGEVVALIEDIGLAHPSWCARVVEAHRAPVAAVGGAVENAGDRPVNWALYFIDFGQFENPVPEGDTLIAADANVSYKRSALASIRSVWSDVFSEHAVNRALRSRGDRIILSSRVITYQNRGSVELVTALRERFVWGWSFGAQRRLSGLSRVVWTLASPVLPFLILARLFARAATRRRLTGRFLKAFPLMALMAAAWCLGETVAYLRGDKTEVKREFEPAPDDYVLPEHPTLSVVVVPVREIIAEGHPSELEAVLRGLETQTSNAPMEIIVPFAVAAAIPSLQARYPRVSFLASELTSPPSSSERIEELRTIGLAAARGDIIAVTEDHVVPDPDWCAKILNAHREPYAAIGGAIENSADRILNWAIYFSDLGRYHNPIQAGPSPYASVVNVSYKRAALDSIRTVWQHRFNETAVHAALLAQGHRLGLSPIIVVRQNRQDVRLGSSVRDFFNWGRSFGSIRARLARPSMRMVYICLSPMIPAALLLRSCRDTLRKRRLITKWIKSFFVSAVLTLAWSCGELVGYIAGEANPPGPENCVRRPQAAS